MKLNVDIEMIIEDKVYGSLKIDDPLIVELINSRPFQRLKGITQSGYAFFLSPKHPYAKFKVTRYEHSIGVYTLLRKIGASKLEQVAGLLHDISHPVFSHCIDFIYGRELEQDFHEIFHEKIMLNSEISDILNKYKVKPEEILDGNFNLMDNEIPDICADRIDYSLRDSVCCLGLEKSKAKNIIDSLVVHEGEIVFSNFRVAKTFGEIFLEIGDMYCNPLQATLFKLVSEIVKLGLEENVLKEEDLFSEEPIVYNKLVRAHHKGINDLLKIISNLKVVEDPKDYDFYLKSKVRYVDPKVLFEKGTKRVSELDDKFKQKIRDFINRKSKGFYVRILK
ncbi:MAG: HD domain-containing protein [Candidatus Aenigmatarchaeota archaeon]